MSHSHVGHNWPCIIVTIVLLFETAMHVAQLAMTHIVVELLEFCGTTGQVP